MSTLAARVLEAIDAAERVTRSATDGPWRVRNLGRHDQAAVVVDTGIRTPVAGLPVGPLVGDIFTARAVADARHVAMNNPSAVFRRCAADRKIVARCEAAQGDGYWEYGDAPILARAVLTALAEAYGVPLEQEET